MYFTVLEYPAVGGITMYFTVQDQTLNSRGIGVSPLGSRSASSARSTGSMIIQEESDLEGAVGKSLSGAGATRDSLFPSRKRFRVRQVRTATALAPPRSATASTFGRGKDAWFGLLRRERFLSCSDMYVRRLSAQSAGCSSSLCPSGIQALGGFSAGDL